MSQSRILVAVSTPWASERLLTMVQNLARRLDAAVIVAHVSKAGEQDETESEIRTRARETLATMTSRLAEANVAAEGLLLYGADVARAILNAAESQNATLLVLGLPVKTGIARFFSTDIPRTILRNCPLPVLTCPPDWSGTI